MGSERQTVDVQGYTPLETFRYERKFLVDEISLEQVRSVIKLHPKMFYMPYPPRFVNNLYLDTVDMENYYDNVNGAGRRRKVRVRWYGELSGYIARPMLEIKVKDGLVGTKHTFSLRGFQLDSSFSDRYFLELLDESGLPAAVRRDLRDMSIVLLNRYFRYYYVSRDGLYRATTDTVMTFHRVNGGSNRMFHRQLNFRDLVVELKYAAGEEIRADRVVGFFPFRMTRNSKYVQGIERVYF